MNSLCHMLVFIHVASGNVWAMPRSIYNMGNFTCLVICNFLRDMRYLIRCIFSIIMQRILIHSWYIQLLCSMSKSIYMYMYVVSINAFACFNTFKTLASIHGHQWHTLCQFLLNRVCYMMYLRNHAFMLKIICCMGRFTFWPLQQFRASPKLPPETD